MANNFPETPPNVGKTVGINSHRLFLSGADRSGGFQPRLGKSGNQPPAFLRIELQTKTLVPPPPQPASVASAAKSKENPSPHLTILQKPTSKYRPPDFISTVMFMQDKLYAVSHICKYTEEPPQGDELNALWKAALKKETCFTGQNVSNILLGLRVSTGE